MIGIVIPVHNSSATLDKCVGSVCGQTYKDIKIILVENGSTDDSYQKCLEWAGKDERIVVLQSEKGVSVARNKGLEYADSIGVDYFGFVDSDDYIESAMYEELHKCASRTGADMVFCEMSQKYDDREKTVCITNEAQKKIKEKDLTPFVYNDKNYVMGSVTRILFKSKGKFRFETEIKLMEDLLFVIQFVKQADNVEFVHVPLYHYALSGSSYSKYYHKDFLEERKRFLQKFEGMANDCKLSQVMKMSVLINMLKSIMENEEDYVAKIKQLYNDDYYRKGCRSINGLKNYLRHCEMTLKGKVSALILYFGFYRIYKSYYIHMHNKAGKKE